jgi:hypothetical protein
MIRFFQEFYLTGQVLDGLHQGLQAAKQTSTFLSQQGEFGDFLLPFPTIAFEEPASLVHPRLFAVQESPFELFFFLLLPKRF